MELQDIMQYKSSAVVMEVHDKGNVSLHFEIYVVIGNTVGHDVLCCHSMGCLKRTERPVRTFILG